MIVSDNCIIYARCPNAVGNYSEIGSIVISNIDKTAPAAPNLSANSTSPTNSNVTVTITYPADATTKQYMVGTGTWTPYTAAVVLEANNTMYARCMDAAGNISATGSIIIRNIDKTAPDAPTLSANPTTPTNGDVTVTITYPADANVKEYKIGEGAWTAYTAAVVLLVNDTVYARCIDAVGNISTTSSAVISNIDKTAPDTPNLSANPTTPTNGNVTVTITYPADASTKQYMVGTGTWTTYTAAVVLTANNTMYARCTDAAGNISATGSIVVGNIDKTAPAAPTLTASTTTQTNGDINVIIFYPADAEMKEYKIGYGIWTTYTGNLTLPENNTVYARCIDAVGNISNTGSIVIGNIDKTAPETPNLSASPTVPTNSDVTVTITYPADASVKEYKIGEGDWTAYTAPVVLTANNTVYARCTDTATNTSSIGSIVVNNIDKTVPETPTLLLSTTSRTNSDVTVTISYPTDAATEEYKIGTGDWIVYTAPVVLITNNTVYARCTDLAGNFSETASIVASNIYKLVVVVGTTAIINHENNFIYGLEVGLTQSSFESLINISGNARFVYTPATDKLGTGTLVELIDKETNEVLETFTIIIFGDINGDGNIDSIDAGRIVDYENDAINWDAFANAAYIKAGDLNGDGNIDSMDAGIAVDVENDLLKINQSTGIAVPS